LTDFFGVLTLVSNLELRAIVDAADFWVLPLTTSDQAVMSALPCPRKSAIIGILTHVQGRLFAFGCGVLLVIYWSESNVRFRG
jgi:hypothetical protein